MKKFLRSHAFYTLLICLLGIVAIQALFHPGLFTAHDIWHQVARFYHYSQALQDGQILPMWISQLAFGYGYPLFVFSYHLPWLLGTPLLWLGLDLFSALKVLYGLSFIAAGLTMYALAYRLTRHRLGSTVAAIIYLWSPYHFLNLFVSAAIGTVFSFFLMPVLFLGVQLLLERQIKKGVLLTTLATACLILTHILTLVLIFPFLIGWVILALVSQSLVKKSPVLSSANGMILLKIIASILAGFLVSAFYLVPLFSYQPLINASENDRGFTDIYKSSVVTIRQLLYSPWGYGPVVSSAKAGEISFQVGIAQWLSVGLSGLLGIWLFIKRKAQLNQPLALLATTLLLFGISIFLMTDYSLPIWKLTNQLVVMDYPFRLLLMAVFFSSLTAGWVISTLKTRRVHIALGVLFVLVAMYTNRNHVRVNQYTEIPLQLYLDSEVTTNTFHEYLPRKTNLPKEVSLTEVVEVNQAVLGEADLQGLKRTTRGLDFTLNLATKSAVTIRHFAFPGIVLRNNGEPTDFEPNADGYIRLELEAGEHHLGVQYEPETKTKVAYLISIFTLVGLGVFIIVNPNRARNRKPS